MGCVAWGRKTLDAQTIEAKPIKSKAKHPPDSVPAKRRQATARVQMGRHGD
jgi:hypothetical protein